MKWILLAFVLFFSACSFKDYECTKTKIIIMKSPKIKFSDVGYLRNSDKSIELELFMAGKSIEKISVNRLICVRKGCMRKSAFNEEYLSDAYPADTMQNLLLSRPIYSGKNIMKTQGGFSQNIQDQNVDISYRVEPDSLFFKDRKNGIIFKMKDMDE